ncbi:MAG: sterol desaturase family protein [Deltaproteobacteria bacterium]|nr:sterol desaturase family protein [Deltaproteobacteria bacterium]
MTHSIFLIIAVDLVCAGLALGGLTLLSRSRLMARHREREDKPHRISKGEHARVTTINSVVSMSMVFGLAWLAHDQLFTTEPRSALRIVFEAVAILAVYDLLYYLYHRFVLHEWAPGRRIHAVHHRIRTPYAPDSVYVHPLETFGGVALLLLSTWLVGPVHVYAFGLCFLVYSVLNLFIHSAFHLPFAPFRTLTAMVDHHDIHHTSMRGGYYASITPLYDWLLRTNHERAGRTTEAAGDA